MSSIGKGCPEMSPGGTSWEAGLGKQQASTLTSDGPLLMSVHILIKKPRGKI
jgi:hypothetical protein